MKAEDVASAVTFVLGTPPHVQVCFSVICSYFDLEVVKLISPFFSFFLFLLSDWRCADETSGAGIIAVTLEGSHHDSLAASAGHVGGKEGREVCGVYRS